MLAALYCKNLKMFFNNYINELKNHVKKYKSIFNIKFLVKKYSLYTINKPYIIFYQSY